MKTFHLVYHVDSTNTYCLIGGCYEKEDVARLLLSCNISPSNMQDYHVVCYKSNGDKEVFDGKYYTYILGNKLKTKRDAKALYNSYESDRILGMIETNSIELIDKLNALALSLTLVKIKFSQIKSYLESIKTTMLGRLSDF